MRRVLTFVMAGGKGERLLPLTKDRAKPAVPFGGIYRIIDFTLSNCINSGIRKIHVLIQYKSYSLQRHLLRGWSIFNSELGEYIDVIPAQQRIDEHWYLGTADAVYQNIYSIEQERPEYVLVLAGDHVYKMNYAEMLAFHCHHHAEATVGVIEFEKERAKGFGIVEVDGQNRIVGFEEKPTDPKTIPGDPQRCDVSMGIYIFTRAALEQALIEDAKRRDSTHDFGRDVIPWMKERFKVMAYNFSANNMTGGEKGTSPYWRDIGTLDAYYEGNMDLVSVTPQFDLYDREWPIRTYHEQWPPVKTVFSDEATGRVGMALDSLVSNGCVISGGRIQRCVLSPDVRINSFADVSDSILMEDVEVGRYAKIRRAIIDKDVSIPRYAEIGYDLEEDRRRFHVTDDGVVVVAKGTVIEEPRPAVSLVGT
ncbi:MAG: glucose-1-phosphate adenylyltransferase [Candidatus Omnitrophica bacterium]|nr:glucose-1-phosphate adenylyltransferase [Candidatus Omnitrophota bacterium]